MDKWLKSGSLSAKAPVKRKSSDESSTDNKRKPQPTFTAVTVQLQEDEELQISDQR